MIEEMLFDMATAARACKGDDLQEAARLEGYAQGIEAAIRVFRKVENGRAEEPKH